MTLAATGQVQFTSSGGWPNFSGVELWQQTAVRAGTATALPAKAAALRAGEAALAYPNPSPDGRFSVRLPADFGGDVRYRLVSALGATLATGTLSAGMAPRLDFSRVMPATGLYYLLLETQQHTAQLKLLRN
ncbi:hypothetical protein GCM10022407_09310 [Hymenobacter antarcticus]|uniref:Por secretion system C-terminal sorting domain-containing protein n=1 Tax=Hymenobacter antarcticus TaxID=486270 RepID=A0ABP7PFX0_9BACT